MYPEIPFTIGFAFDPNLTRVLLIKKARGPLFNIGKWNGIGGKFNLGEGIRACMRREFLEETGIDTDETDWNIYHIEHHLALEEQKLNPRLYFLTTQLTKEKFNSYKSMTDELVTDTPIDWVLDDIYRESYVYNLPYLVAMARTWLRHPKHRWIEG